MVEGRVYIGDVFINHYVSDPEVRLYMIIDYDSDRRDSFYKILHANGHVSRLYARSVKYDPNHKRIGHINVKRSVKVLFKDYLQKEEEKCSET